MSEANRIIEDALSLPADERLDLVDRLLTSLNLPTEAEVDKLWRDEAERRVAQLDAGEARLVPGETVLAKIRRKHRK